MCMRKKNLGEKKTEIALEVLRMCWKSSSKYSLEVAGILGFGVADF